MIRCAAAGCLETGADEDPGWIHAAIELKDAATGRVLVRSDEDFCPTHGSEAIQLMRTEDRNGRPGHG